MWNVQTKIFDRTILDQEKKETVYKLVNEFNISPVGVAIVFDNENYQAFPNKVWRNQGVHINIKDGGIEDWSPQHLYDIMDSSNYTNLIWISKKICLGDSIQFVWVISHEFQHYVQNSICNLISVSNHFLYECFRDCRMVIDEPKEAVTIPHEFDAELAALRMTIKIFGNKRALNYIEDPKNRSRFEKVISFDTNQDYDVISNTIGLLTKYRSRLINFIQKTDDSFLKEFDIDRSIDELNKCSKVKIRPQRGRLWKPLEGDTMP